MARFEFGDSDYATLGDAPAGADTFFELGMMYSVGRSVPVDYVSAHKWFNLAAHARQRGSDPVAPRDRRPDVGGRDRRGSACRAVVDTRPTNQPTVQLLSLAFYALRASWISLNAAPRGRSARNASCEGSVGSLTG